MKKVHFVSGLVLSLFVGIHLFNHLWAFHGDEAHISLMNKLRPYYRNVFCESLLLFSTLVQVISGVLLITKKRKHILAPLEKVQIWSGLYLAFFLLVHISAILIGRQVMDLDTNFHYAVAGLHTFPHCLFFIPYYLLGMISFFAHVSAIHGIKMKSHLLSISSLNQAKIIFSSGIIISLYIMYSLTLGLNQYQVPTEYLLK